MKKAVLGVVSALVFASSLISISAQQKESAAPPLTAAERERHTEEKHAKPILDALALKDADKETKLRPMLAEHFKALNEWHEQNDAKIKALWTEFDKARSAKSDAGADAALEKIDGAYASFKPEHEKFDGELGTILTPEQIETVKDAMTINKVKITFNAYGEIFPGITDEHNAFILKNLKAAREEAIDAGSMPEKSAFFKKYKIKIEAYLTAHGFDVKESYRVFVAKQKAKTAAQTEEKK
jgi:Spy/CpxP family protein refolding chaperone